MAPVPAAAGHRRQTPARTRTTAASTLRTTARGPSVPARQAEQPGAVAEVPATVLTPNGQDGEPTRVLVWVLLAGVTQDRPVSWQDIAQQTGLSRSRAYALLGEERARLAAGNGHQPTLDPTDTTP